MQAALAMPDMIWSDSGRGQECTLRSGTREVWDAQTGEEVNDHVLPSSHHLLLRALVLTFVLIHEQECTLTGHSAAVNSVAFSPDGTRVVSASGEPFKSDNTVRIWDVASGKEVGASGPGHARYDLV